ncbi:a2d4b20f-cae4-4f5c-9210-343e9d6981b8 [Sclerotinia trifoliorum]|uniref:A2d4b20f-cae4-4f5c-9210-343e9d6981b8 n=1 Tax=Sclerotinia trifoliorum TaxID=28548 RepID=A0A8H2ZPG3_9HELO|nr:a2d4b20f-cae4-4f5c-9210-343e9d6981b8 [Sclerotinia trifoliorum]
MEYPWSPYGSPERFNQGQALYPNAVAIPDGDSPSTTWLPIYNQRSPYDENEIVDLINEIVRDFVRLSSVSESEVIWPPEGGHNLDESLCNSLNIDISETAKSLIRRLPDPATTQPETILLYGSSSLFTITNSYDLSGSREAPPCSDPNLQYLLPHEVQLAIGETQSTAIILDTNENTIRVVSLTEGADEVNPPWVSLERPEDTFYYRNYWPRHAPTWLRVQSNKIKCLDTIPPGIHGYTLSYLDYGEEWMRRKIKHSLEGTYGWPSDFQQSAWDQDRERVWKEADKEYVKLSRPSVLRFV